MMDKWRPQGTTDVVFLLSIVVCFSALGQCFIETLDFDVYMRLHESTAKVLTIVLTSLCLCTYEINS